MNYLDIINESFDAAQKTVKKLFSNGKYADPINIGAFGDLTFRIDKEVEAAMLSVVRKHLPDSIIVSEEVGVTGPKDGFPLILIDPIDGSTNASKNVPFYSSVISIIDGYKYCDVASSGVIDLVHGDRFLSKGHGKVMVNGSIVKPSKSVPLEESYIGVNVLLDKDLNNAKWLNYLLSKIKYPRFLGSAALETAYVAIGKSNAFIQINPNLRSFDCIASLFLVEQAGGSIDFLNMVIDKVDLRNSKQRFSYVAACDKAMLNSIMWTKS
ncbi:MAG TPA: inositol monophosphatase family protein [Nitrososphaerales archaeon]